MRGEADPLTEEIIAGAIEVHRALGPGLLESAYGACLLYELRERGLEVRGEVPLPVTYKGVSLDCGYRVDILVGGRVVVEVKAVSGLLAVHEAQLLSYLRLGGWPVGLLINFHSYRLVDGVRRLVR